MLELQKEIYFKKIENEIKQSNVFLDKKNILILNEINDLINTKEKYKQDTQDVIDMWGSLEIVVPFIIAMVGLSISLVLVFKNPNFLNIIASLLGWSGITWLGYTKIMKLRNKNKKYMNVINGLKEIELNIKEKIELLNKNGFFHIDNNVLTNEEKVINKKISELKDEIIFSGIMKSYDFTKKQENKKIIFNFEQLICMILSYKILKDEENIQTKYDL